MSAALLPGTASASMGRRASRRRTCWLRVAPKAAGDREEIVIAVSSGKVTDAVVRAQTEEAMLASRRGAPRGGIGRVALRGPHGAAQVSPSGRIAFANVTMTKQAVKVTTSEARQFVRTAQAGAQRGLAGGGRGSGRATRPTGRNISSVGLGAAAALDRAFSWSSARCSPRRCRCWTAGIALGTGTACDQPAFARADEWLSSSAELVAS